MHVLAIVHDVVPIVIANNLYTEFPNDSSLITFMLTGPGLLLVVSSIIAGRLLERVSYKVMLLIGCALFAVAATLGTFVPSPLHGCYAWPRWGGDGHRERCRYLDDHLDNRR